MPKVPDDPRKRTKPFSFVAPTAEALRGDGSSDHELQPNASPPKKQKITGQRRVSASTIETLQRLDEVIAEASKHLRKMPGSREDDAAVNVTSVLWCEEEHDGSDTFDLLLHDDAIQVRQRSSRIDFETDYIEYTTLDKFDTSTRIKLCGFIPDLIIAAKHAEQKVRQAADDAIESILQAIAESMEVGDESQI